jgi:uncharacterized membrane protein
MISRVYEKLAGGSKPLFVDARRARAAPRPARGRLSARAQGRRAPARRPGRRRVPGELLLELRAWGDDPFWRVDVSRNGIIWSSYGAPSSVAFPRPAAPRGAIRYAVVRKAPSA